MAKWNKLKDKKRFKIKAFLEKQKGRNFNIYLSGFRPLFCFFFNFPHLTVQTIHQILPLALFVNHTYRLPLL